MELDSEQKRLRIALIGLGDIAQKAYLPLVASHSEITPVLCSRNAQTLKALSQRYRINECYQTVEALISAGVDGAMIHSSTSSHYTLALQLLQAGIAVFVDKPLSYVLQESEAILNLAAQKNLPLMVGFNRRHAPLIKPLKLQDNPVQIIWQKNRVQLPDVARVFVLDDFIHVLDSLRFLAPSNSIANLQVFSRFQDKKLAAIRVQWQSGECFLEAAMNRISGIAEERLEFFTEDNKWQIDNLTCGQHCSEGVSGALGFNDWQSTLYKRGFESMLQVWVEALRKGGSDSAALEDIRATHILCEQVLQQLPAHIQ